MLALIVIATFLASLLTLFSGFGLGTLLMIIFFLLVQRRVVGGLTAGAVKG